MSDPTSMSFGVMFYSLGVCVPYECVCLNGQVNFVVCVSVNVGEWVVGGILSISS